MLAGVSSEADKCRMMPDGTFTQIDDKPAASAALSPHGSARCVRAVCMRLVSLLEGCSFWVVACVKGKMVHGLAHNRHGVPNAYGQLYAASGAVES